MVSGDGRHPLATCTKLGCALSLYAVADCKEDCKSDDCKCKSTSTSSVGERNQLWSMRSVAGKPGICFGETLSLAPLSKQGQDNQPVFVTIASNNALYDDKNDLIMDMAGPNGIPKKSQRFMLVPAFHSELMETCNAVRRYSCIRTFIQQLGDYRLNAGDQPQGM